MVEHFLPTTLTETLDILDTNKVEIIAGGTDLMVQRRTWANTLPKFDQTINIIHVKELNFIRQEGSKLHIGATTSYTTLLQHPDVPQLLKDCISVLASPALRNIATIAGNIGNASPAGDTLPILYLYDAIIELSSKHRVRYVPIQDVIVGPRKTTIEYNELITSIILPLHDFSTVRFDKVGGRKADAISKISMAAAARIEDGVIEDIRFAFGAVGPIIVRDTGIEEELLGRTIEDIPDVLPTILSSIASRITPIDDQRSNKNYRSNVALNLLQDFLLTL